MRMRGLCSRKVPLPPSVRLSVCLSVTFVYCIQTAEDIIKLLSEPGTIIILVFLTPAPVPNSKWNPFSGGAKYMGWQNLRLSIEIAVNLGSDTR